MKIAERVTTTTRIERNVDLGSVQIIDLLKGALDIPDNAEVYFTVPGGADWSNCKIDVDQENPITIRWVEVTESAA